MASVREGRTRRSGGLADVLRAQIFDPSSYVVGQLVEAGIARGELRPGVSAEVVNDVLFGALVARSLHGTEINDDWIDRVLVGVLVGFGVRSEEPPTQGAAGAQTGERTQAVVPSWD